MCFCLRRASQLGGEAGRARPTSSIRIANCTNVIQTRAVITYNTDRQDDYIQARVEHSTGDRVQSRHTMTWEWQHGRKGGQWVVTVGGWNAVVQRLGGARVLWQATLTRVTLPQEHYTSPPYADAIDARTWCFRTIAELAGKIP